MVRVMSEVPSAVLGGDIEEDGFALPGAGVVGKVVKAAGVFPGADDGGVGEAARTPAGELVDELRLDLPLADAGFHEAQQAAEAGLGDFTRGFDELDFLSGFDYAELVEEGGEPPVAVEREARLAFSDEAAVARFDAGGG